MTPSSTSALAGLGAVLGCRIMGTTWSTGYWGRWHPPHPQPHARCAVDPARGDTRRNATAPPFLQSAVERIRLQQLPSRGPHRRAAQRLSNHLDGNILTTYPWPRKTPADLRAFAHQATSSSASARSTASRSLGVGQVVSPHISSGRGQFSKRALADNSRLGWGIRHIHACRINFGRSHDPLKTLRYQRRLEYLSHRTRGGGYGRNLRVSVRQHTSRLLAAL